MDANRNLSHKIVMKHRKKQIDFIFKGCLIQIGHRLIVDIFNQYLRIGAEKLAWLIVFVLLPFSLNGNCWKKNIPLSNGRIDPSVVGKALIKIRKDNFTTKPGDGDLNKKHQSTQP